MPLYHACVYICACIDTHNIVNICNFYVNIYI